MNEVGSEALERAERIREALGGEHAWRGGVEEARRVVAEAREALDALLAEVARLERWGADQARKFREETLLSNKLAADQQCLRVALAEIAAACTPTLDVPQVDRVAVISDLARAALGAEPAAASDEVVISAPARRALEAIARRRDCTVNAALEEVVREFELPAAADEPTDAPLTDADYAQAKNDMPEKVASAAADEPGETP